MESLTSEQILCLNLYIDRKFRTYKDLQRLSSISFDYYEINNFIEYLLQSRENGFLDVYRHHIYCSLWCYYNDEFIKKLLEKIFETHKQRSIWYETHISFFKRLLTTNKETLFETYNKVNKDNSTFFSQTKKFFKYAQIIFKEEIKSNNKVENIIHDMITNLTKMNEYTTAFDKCRYLLKADPILGGFNVIANIYSSTNLSTKSIDHLFCTYFSKYYYKYLTKKQENEIMDLKKEVLLLEERIKYMPEGEGYYEAKNHFEKLQNN